MKPLRILLVCGSLSPGGIQQMILQEAESLVEMGHRVDICTMSSEMGELADDAARKGATVHATCSPRNISTFLRRFETLLKDAKYDVVHVQRSSHYSALPVSLAARNGVPVCVAHYQNIARGGLRSLPDPMLRALVLKYATNILGVSRPVLDSQFGSTWKKDQRFVLLPNSIDIQLYKGTCSRSQMRRELNLEETDFALGHCGRFSAAKNQEFLVRIFPEILQRLPHARLVLAGSGDGETEVKGLVDRMGLQDRVIFPGWRDEFRHSIYSALDLFLMPSLWEGFGIVLLEAQASGLPCIANPLECFEGVLSPENAAMATPLDNPGDWIKRVIALAGDAEERHRLSNSARVHVEKFDRRAHARELIEIYTGGKQENASS
ncbi:MAG: glycosyltransferase [Candidatus Sumerlaeia bacterium]|nr:glycosyltransferase [Candidatus Sumerlaeia bacterium]